MHDIGIYAVTAYIWGHGVTRPFFQEKASTEKGAASASLSQRFH